MSKAKHNIENSILSSKTFIFTITSLLLFSIIFTILFQFVFGIALVKGESMKPTLYNGQILFFLRNKNDIKNGDVLIIKTQNNKILIKRLVASPGEYIQIFDGCLYVNGERQENNYDKNIKFAGIAENVLQLGENEYFVLGDNRNNSQDSRYTDVGLIKIEDVIGVVKGK